MTVKTDALDKAIKQYRKVTGKLDTEDKSNSE